MISRVGNVAVKLRLADSDRDRADDTRRTIEQVVLRHALDELERAIHDRYGRTTIVRARRLAVRWRLEHATLSEQATALELGRDLAEALVAEIETTPKPQRLRPDPDANVVVFADEEHAIATFLADRADAREAWFHAPREDALAEWTAAVASGVPRIEAIVRWLDRMDRRARVARMIEHATSAVAAASRRLAEEATPAQNIAALEAGEPRAVVPRVSPAARAHEDASDITTEPASPATEMPREVALEAEVGTATLDTPTIVPTRAAGLWYLARLVMQLDLAEHLWAAGVLEGDFLAHVACAIAGHDLVDDPCWRWFGGAFDREPRLDPLPDWAADELATKRDASLQRLVPGAPPLDALADHLPCLFPAEARARDAVTRSAAALCTLFCARLGIAPDVERLRGYLRLTGHLELGEPVRVTIPMELIDVDLRRAGLDLDPGFLPWLGRKVEIAFESESDDPAASGRAEV